MITRFDNDYFEKARFWCSSSRGRRLYILRKTVIEGLFGDAKAHHGLSRAKLRRLDIVEILLLLTATILNLKRLIKKLNREIIGSAMQKLENRLQYLFFGYYFRFMIRPNVCLV
ncbi:MAG: transposase [Actinobacteria bacterium]|nr:transposase [Actinomycetota bacterium]